MNKAPYIPPCLDNIFVVKAMQIAQEQEEACLHWWDEAHFHKLMTPEERVTYYNQCYEPAVAIDPQVEVSLTPSDIVSKTKDVRVTIRCKACDPNNYNPCHREFPKTTTILKAEVKKIFMPDENETV